MRVCSVPTSGPLPLSSRATEATQNVIIIFKGAGNFFQISQGLKWEDFRTNGKSEFPELMENQEGSYL